MPSLPSFTLRQVARLRMQAQGLIRPATTLEGVVRRHLAMQGQDFRAARWAVGCRVPGTTAAELLQAFDRGTIVRSWPMRGTVHLTAAEDLPWMLELLGPRALSGVERRWKQLGLTRERLEGARAVAVERLSGGRACTRGELAESFAEAGVAMEGQQLYHAVWYLSQTGTLVQGPTRQGEPLLVLLREWIPNPRYPGSGEPGSLDVDGALAELGRRYLEARGPATPEDLAHWTKLPKTQCRRAFALNTSDVVEVMTPLGPGHMTRGQLESLDPDSPEVDQAVHALPAFDEHLLGYRNRDPVLDPAHATRVDPGRNGVFRWTVVVGGRVAGTWARTRRTHHMKCQVLPFPGADGRRVRSRAVRAQVEAAIAAWGAFEGTPVEVEWETAEG